MSESERVRPIITGLKCEHHESGKNWEKEVEHARVEDMVESILYAAIAPWILALLASIWHYPAPLEELVKWVIIMSKVEEGLTVLNRGVWVGLAFGISELGIYAFGAWQSGTWEVLVSRLVITVPMHILTALVSAMGIKTQRWIAELILLLTAMMIHAIFNYTIR